MPHRPARKASKVFCQPQAKARAKKKIHFLEPFAKVPLSC